MRLPSLPLRDVVRRALPMLAVLATLATAGGAALAADALPPLLTADPAARAESAAAGPPAVEAVPAADRSGTPATTPAPAEPPPDDLGDLLDYIAGDEFVGPPATDPASAAPAAADAPAAAAVAPGIDVWERIRRGFAMPELETKLAANRTTWYANQPDYIQRMATRASLYLFHIVEEIEKRGMPTELALLPFVESAMQPEAVSVAQAAGLWQFIPSTGKLYALEQNLWRDERRDVIASTRAALDYLQKLYGDFGDWHLALAAYNWGEGAVGRALARNRAQRKPAVYTALRMPRETQYYVPKLQAIKNIVRDPGRYGITLPPVRNEPYFVALTKTRDIDVTTAARLAEMPVDDFRALNPGFNRPLIVGAAQPQILLPAERAEAFLANLAAWEATGQPLASWTTYRLQPGETLAQVAARAGVAEAQLREANSIPPRYRLAAGSTVLVPRDETMEDDIAVEHLDASFSLVPEHANLRKVTYRVRRGDTLHAVARRWKVDPQEIVAWNRLRSESLFAGQRLTLTVARAAPATRAGARKAVHRPVRGTAKSPQAAARRTPTGSHSAAARPTRSAARPVPQAAVRH